MAKLNENVYSTKKRIKLNKLTGYLIAPLPHRYKRCKEGYVKKKNHTKPNTCAGYEHLFLVKANVSASMKQQYYSVYCHLDQASAEVKFPKCNCKAGQHIAAVLYTSLDYSNRQLEEVPDDVMWTQVLKKWSVPSLRSNI